MSFSSDLKEELSKINNLKRKDELELELIGYLISRNSSIIKNNIRYATESEYNINRFSKLLKNLNIEHKIEYDGKSFIIIFKSKDKPELININNGQIELKDLPKMNEYQKRALIRGTFLGSGSINNPEKTYHLEINVSTENNLKKVYKIIQDCGIQCKKLEQENKYSVYLKDGEEISTIIALLGANTSVLKFEDIRVQKDMRGKVNRIVNCQTANLNKTINASVEQIDAIRKLKMNNKFNKLDHNLKEIAELRLEYPDMPLVELGKLLKKPVGKSGVNYRLKKIIEIANES